MTNDEAVPMVRFLVRNDRLRQEHLQKALPMPSPAQVSIFLQITEVATIGDLQSMDRK
jgi:hypothetical protein